MPVKSKTVSKPAAASPAKQDNSQAKIEELEKKIAALESKLAALEAACNAAGGTSGSSKDEELREKLRAYFSSAKTNKRPTVYPEL